MYQVELEHGVSSELVRLEDKIDNAEARHRIEGTQTVGTINGTRGVITPLTYFTPPLDLTPPIPSKLLIISTNFRVTNTTVASGGTLRPASDYFFHRQDDVGRVSRQVFTGVMHDDRYSTSLSNIPSVFTEFTGGVLVNNETIYHGDGGRPANFGDVSTPQVQEIGSVFAVVSQDDLYQAGVYCLFVKGNQNPPRTSEIPNGGTITLVCDWEIATIPLY